MTTQTQTVSPSTPGVSRSSGDKKSLDLFGNKARKAAEAAEAEMIKRINDNWHRRRQRACTKLPATSAMFICNTGPKGGSCKSSAQALIAAAGNAVTGEGTGLVEATYEGSLRSNYGLSDFPAHAGTLLSYGWEHLEGKSLEDVPVSHRPTLRMGQLRQHTYAAAGGVDVLLQPPQSLDDTEIWYTRERLGRVLDEFGMLYTLAFCDTGNEPTPLKIVAFRRANGFNVITSTATATWESALEHIKTKLLKRPGDTRPQVPVLTVVVNRENAPDHEVHEIMKKFAPYGPVRMIPFVPYIRDTGLIHYNQLTAQQAEYYLEAYATDRELVAGVTTDVFCTDPEFDDLQDWLKATEQEVAAAREAEQRAQEEALASRRRATEAHQQRLADEAAAAREQARQAAEQPRFTQAGLPVGDTRVGAGRHAEEDDQWGDVRRVPVSNQTQPPTEPTAGPPVNGFAASPNPTGAWQWDGRNNDPASYGLDDQPVITSDLPHIKWPDEHSADHPASMPAPPAAESSVPETVPAAPQSASTHGWSTAGGYDSPARFNGHQPTQPHTPSASQADTVSPEPSPVTSAAAPGNDEPVVPPSWVRSVIDPAVTSKPAEADNKAPVYTSGPRARQPR